MIDFINLFDIIRENKDDKVSLKYQLALRHIKVYWKDGKLKKNGRSIKYRTVQTLLRDINPELTDRETWDIVFNDISVYSELKPHIQNAAAYKNTEIKIAKKSNELARKKRELKNKREFEKLIDNSKPQDYGLDDYMRMSIGHTTAALLAAHAWLTEIQAKKIVGKWVLKRL